MNKIFEQEIIVMREVYIYDIIAKYAKEKLQDGHLTAVYNFFHFNIRLNHEKYTFKVKADKLFEFHLEEKGIKANLDKCDTIIKIETTSMKERIIRLNNMLTAFNKFISKSSHHDLPLYILLRKEVQFEWTTKYKQEFSFKTLGDFETHGRGYLFHIFGGINISSQFCPHETGMYQLKSSLLCLKGVSMS